MKKKNFLIEIAIIGVAFFGTGYACWNDSLTVNTTVQTGKLKMIAVVSKQKESRDENEKCITSEVIEGYSGFCYRLDKKLIPGSDYEFEAAFINQGTIPAVLEEIMITPSADADTESYESLYGSEMVFVLQDEKEEVIRQLEIEGEMPLRTLTTQINNKLQEEEAFKIEVGQSIILKGKVTLNPKLTYKNGKNKCEGKEASFDIKLMYKQHNQ